MNDPLRQATDAFTQKVTDDGKLLEAGFQALRVQVLQGWSADAIKTARLIYMAGAQHLWASMFSVLSGDAEPTMKDMLRMSLIETELKAIEPQLRAMVMAGQQTGPMQ